MRRLEFKYILDPITALRARGFVSRLARPDPAAGKSGWYTVTSLYFDTPSLTDYYEKNGGFLVRKKMRARIYQSSLPEGTAVWLEIKKKYDMSFEKERVLVSYDDWQNLCKRQFTRLLEKERPQKDRQILEEFIRYLLREGRRPLYFIRYRRSPYVIGEKNPVRITFDERIETHAQNNLTEPQHLTRTTNNIILEIKFTTGLPYWFGAMVRRLDLQRTSFSKYSRSIDAVQAYNPLPR